MTITIVGNWNYPIYEDAFSQGLMSHGIEVQSVELNRYFNSIFGHYQQALPVLSYSLLSINKLVLKEVRKQKPDIVLFWRPTHILPSTVKKIKQAGIFVVSFNNDDPFGPAVSSELPWHHKYLWYWYLKTLPYYDSNFFYRKVNLSESLKAGAINCHLLLPYFRPWQDRPITLNEKEKEKFDSDIVFVGHYEDDERLEYLSALLENGYRVKVWGGRYWNEKNMGGVYDKLTPIEPAVGEDYTKALTGSKICLAFLSKLNRDTYTRRCFEIPATGKVMLAERTKELTEMFVEDKEACFFSNSDELLKKTKWLLKNPEIREEIAQAGLKRVWKDGHDVMSRTGEFLKKLNI